MKIQTQLQKTADTIELNGSILTINGKDYDLDNALPLAEIGKTESGEPILESPENQRIYKQGDDTIIFLNVDVELQFLSINYNLMRFFDIDSNNVIDLDELAIFVDHWSKTESDRREIRNDIMERFLKTGTKEDWKKKGIPA